MDLSHGINRYKSAFNVLQMFLYLAGPYLDMWRPLAALSSGAVEAHPTIEYPPPPPKKKKKKKKKERKKDICGDPLVVKASAQLAQS